MQLMHAHFSCVKPLCIHWKTSLKSCIYNCSCVKNGFWMLCKQFDGDQMTRSLFNKNRSRTTDQSIECCQFFSTLFVIFLMTSEVLNTELSSYIKTGWSWIVYETLRIENISVALSNDCDMSWYCIKIPNF